MGQNHIYNENALGRGRYRHPLVRRLLAGQFPQWAGLPIEPVQPLGADNAIYRLGDAMDLANTRWVVLVEGTRSTQR